MKQVLTLIIAFGMALMPFSGLCTGRFPSSETSASEERAEHRQFAHINTSNSALSSDCVKALLQDSRGFIWIGTVSGVNRYDGTRIKTYMAPDLGQVSDFVTCLEEDSDGNIWVATSTGVSYYDYRQDRFFPMDVRCESGEHIVNMVNTLVSDPRGYMWFSVNKQGVFQFDIRNRVLVKHNISFRRFAIASDGSIWSGSYYNGLFFSDKELYTMESFSKKSPYFEGDQIQMLSFSRKDPSLLYVASLDNGLSVVDTKSSTVRRLCALPEEASLISAFMEDERRWWASTSKGLFCYDLQDGVLQSYYRGESEFSISGDYIFCSLVDSEGGLWVGGKDGGVDYSGPEQSRFRKIISTSDGMSLRKSIVSYFEEDSYGNVWVATGQSGLMKWDGTALNTVLGGESIGTISTLSSDGDYLWIGTLAGLYRMDIKTGEIKSYGALPTFDNLKDPRVYNVMLSSSGTLYASTTRGICYYDRAKDVFVPMHSPGNLFYTDIREAPDGTFWLSSFYDGLFRIDPSEDVLLASYKRADGLPDDRITSVFLSGEGDVWAIGFSGGFSKLDRARSQFLPVNKNTHTSLDSDMFMGCVADADGRMWMSTAHGLVLYYPETSEITVFHLLDGILDEKLSRAVLRSSDGRLYFGSDNGFIIVDPFSSSKLPSETAELVITELSVGGETVLPGKRQIITRNIDLAPVIHLKADQNSFSFSFASPGQYARAHKLSQYLLEGYSQDWVQIPQDGTVTFYSIPSGTYTLKIRTRSDSLWWMESHRDVSVIVDKKFFESLPGILLILLCLLLAIAVAVFVILRHSERRRQEQDELARKKREEEMFYEKMNFFSHVVHEIKTPLTLIRTPLSEVLEREDLPEEIGRELSVVKSNTAYLSSLVNELLEYVRVERKGYLLSPVPINLGERVDFLLFNYSDTTREKGIRIQFEKTADPCWVSADSSALNKILNNLLINAVKYAESLICIRMESLDGARVRLSIINDGQPIPSGQREDIFKPFVRYNHSGSGFGIGLPLARSLAQMHSGSLVLKDSERTCFELELPSIAAPDDSSGMSAVIVDSTSMPTLVVVDDNDQMRSYLGRKLSDKYTVLPVAEAESAVKLIRDQRVDLLITDISMPGMNGLELCRSIRSDIEISHLPIIVLSARSSEESKIQAMEAGADLYVEKPFNLELLRLSISNILDRRALMRKSLTSGQLTNDIHLFGLPGKDEEFFHKFDTLITDNIASSELSNAFLASNLAVSEATLVRKIRKLLDTTPVDYIRTKRLNLAAAMLKEGARNVSEIAYDLGFNSPAYFSKCFRDYFGCTPSEYKPK